MREFDKDLFTTNLKLLRQKKKLNQRQLGELIGVSRGVIANYENGATIPSLPMIIKLVEALEISINTLIFNFGQPDEDPELKVFAEDQERYIIDYKQKNEALSVQVSDLRREINTLRAYTARLEKDLAKYEERQ